MANIKDCPGFETFGADVKAARKVKQLSRKTLAEQVNIDWRYLANIENDGTIPSLPVIIQLIKICGLPVERYFNPEVMREESAQRQRVSHKLKLCPEEFLPIIEGAIDGAIQIQQKARRLTHECCNYCNGNCLLLDDGEECVCVQSISYSLLCRWFKVAVLPLDAALCAEITKGRDEIKRCAVCGAAFTPNSNRAKYCADCAVQVRRKKEAERQRKRYLLSTHLGR